jgi:hypothetical protein
MSGHSLKYATKIAFTKKTVVTQYSLVENYQRYGLQTVKGIQSPQKLRYSIL